MDNMIIENLIKDNAVLVLLYIVGTLSASLYVNYTNTKNVWWYKIIEKVALMWGKAKQMKLPKKKKK